MEDGRNNGEGGARPATKPQLRVYIPGQKEFIPRTVSISHQPFKKISDLSNTYLNKEKFLSPNIW